MNEQPELWTAVYCPSDGALTYKNRFDLESREAAEAHVVSTMCKACKGEYDRAKAGTSDPENPEHDFDSLSPGCMCEWLIMKTSEYERSETDEELMEAGGWETIYVKDDLELRTRLPLQ